MSTFLKDEFTPFVLWYFICPGAVYFILINYSFELLIDTSLLSFQNITQTTKSIIYFLILSFIIGIANLICRCILLKLKGNIVKKCLFEFGEDFNDTKEIDAKMFIQLNLFVIVFAIITTLFILIGDGISKL